MNTDNKGLLRKTGVATRILILVAILVSIILKLWLVLSDVLPFNSDEAVVALMARHILEGERPIFFYGQAYMGSLDAWFIAVGFWIFGQQVWVIRFVQSILYIGILITTYILGEIALGSKRAGVIAVGFLAIPNVIVSLYTTVSLGGYGEGLLIGNLILILGLRISESLKQQNSVSIWSWIAWGFLSGFGLWVLGLTLIYSFPMVLFLLYRLAQSSRSERGWLSIIFWKRIGFISLGAIIGSIPWWIYAIRNGLSTLISELSGSAVSVEQSHWLIQIGQHISRFLLFGSTAAFGMRPSWEIRWLGLPLLPVVLAFWVGVLYFIIRRFSPGKVNRFGAGTLVGVMLVLAAGYIFTPFGVDPSGRYFVPLVIPLSLFAGEMLLSLVDRYGRWVYGFIAIIIVYNLWGTIQSAERFPPGITTQFNPITQVDQNKIGELMSFLEDNGETRGYTNYWVSYPLAFLSKETLIFVPRLPYHRNMDYTSRDDRYEPYDLAVESSNQAAFITTNHPTLNNYLREHFENKGLTWKEHQIGDYFIFFDLSELITPEEIGLGFET